MTPPDTLFIGIPMLAGMILIARSATRLISAGGFGRLQSGIDRLHKAAHERAIEAGLFRFPGACLIPSARGWLAGEAVFLGTVAIALTRRPSAWVGLWSLVAAAVLGGSVAFLANRDLARRQIDGIRAALPVASFLMSLLLEAGSGPYSALKETTRALPRGPLVSELEELARSRMIGIPRADAIERSRKRVPLEDYRTFLNLLEQGERLGVGLSQALQEHSSRMLEAQGHRAETVAQKAAVKLLFPLVVFIFPAVFLIILSPVILSLWAMLGR